MFNGVSGVLGDGGTGRVLWGLGYSPWTEQARWALDHHGIGYGYREHRPLLGERRLRRRARRGEDTPSGTPVSVPLLVTPREIVADSFAIAEWSDRHGGAANLLPNEQREKISVVHEVAERGRQAGRALVIAAMRHDGEAKRESLAGIVPGPLRGVMQPVASQGVRFLARKYGVDARSIAEHETTLVKALDRLRRELDDREYILGMFSFADVTMATLLSMIRPRPELAQRLGPATTDLWTHARLADEYDDLLRWRDRVYRCHRTPSRPQRAN